MLAVNFEFHATLLLPGIRKLDDWAFHTTALLVMVVNNCLWLSLNFALQYCCLEYGN